MNIFAYDNSILPLVSVCVRPPARLIYINSPRSISPSRSLASSSLSSVLTSNSIPVVVLLSVLGLDTIHRLSLLSLVLPKNQVVGSCSWLTRSGRLVFRPYHLFL
jgi:hypothetical protein